MTQNASETLGVITSHVLPSGGGSSQGEKPTYTINEIGEWYNVWLMAIALAWKDPVFKKELLEHPRAALAARLHYKFPWSVNLVIKDATGVDGSGWLPDPKGAGNGTWKLPATDVLLWLPPAPPMDEQPVALGNYAYTAQTYPFTCCC
jgi:ribosomally synthesized peptide (two-chain TOMM family)